MRTLEVHRKVGALDVWSNSFHPPDRIALWWGKGFWWEGVSNFHISLVVSIFVLIWGAWACQLVSGYLTKWFVCELLLNQCFCEGKEIPGFLFCHIAYVTPHHAVYHMNIRWLITILVYILYWKLQENHF